MRRSMARGSQSTQIDDAVVHGDGEGLGAAHAAEAGGEGDGPGEGAAELLRGDGGEGLVGALEDALGADVDPGAGRHLPVHGQAEGLQAAELLPVGPVADEVGVGDEDARGPLVGLHDADRAAGLDEHRLVLLELLQGADHGVEGAPVAGRLARAAVDDELVGVLGDLGVEVVLQHPQGGLLLPAQGAQRRTAWRSDGARGRPGGPRLRVVAGDGRAGSGHGLPPGGLLPADCYYGYSHTRFVNRTSQYVRVAAPGACECLAGCTGRLRRQGGSRERRHGHER